MKKINLLSMINDQASKVAEEQIKLNALKKRFVEKNRKFQNGDVVRVQSGSVHQIIRAMMMDDHRGVGVQYKTKFICTKGGHGNPTIVADPILESSIIKKIES